MSERDIRQLMAIKYLFLFEKFVCLCAGRVGQLLNLQSLGNDTGISHTTARNWLTLLQPGQKEQSLLLAGCPEQRGGPAAGQRPGGVSRGEQGRATISGYYFKGLKTFAFASPAPPPRACF